MTRGNRRGQFFDGADVIAGTTITNTEYHLNCADRLRKSGRGVWRFSVPSKQQSPSSHRRERQVGGGLPACEAWQYHCVWQQDEASDHSTVLLRRITTETLKLPGEKPRDRVRSTGVARDVAPKASRRIITTPLATTMALPTSVIVSAGSL